MTDARSKIIHSFIIMFTSSSVRAMMRRVSSSSSSSSRRRTARDYGTTTRCRSGSPASASAVASETTGSSSSASSSLSVVSWNVNGVRALMKKDPLVLDTLASRTRADVLALQETKLGADGERALGDADAFLADYGVRAFATSAGRKGYSGVALFIRNDCASTIKRIERVELGIEEFDVEGRALVAELDSCYVVNAYVPNSGADLKRLDARVDAWERAMRAYINNLQSGGSGENHPAGKPVVYCGDLNVAHEDVDLWGRHAENAKSAGFTPRERAAMSTLLTECDMIDTYRTLHGPNAQAFTYWSYRGGARAKNRGWRLDYVLASASLRRRVEDAYALPDVLGSDHCPVGVVFRDM